ncbi:hypothetical protein, partial [Chromohalobacter sp. HP20-39]|uniref:hypothetical protein n=1 Tax=Chromohalobacter sp. HP20-39 TaxID=3079306 RepID=UPI00294AF158
GLSPAARLRRSGSLEGAWPWQYPFLKHDLAGEGPDAAPGAKGVLLLSLRSGRMAERRGEELRNKNTC